MTPDYTERTMLRPVTKRLGPTGPFYPAFEFNADPTKRPSGEIPPTIILAADTDGDGIADANYFKLPVGRLNGLDYYAAIRIVDNNSAVNASTAYGDVLNPGVATFPSSVNMLNLIAGPDSQSIRQQIHNLHRSRFQALQHRNP